MNSVCKKYLIKTRKRSQIVLELGEEEEIDHMCRQRLPYKKIATTGLSLIQKCLAIVLSITVINQGQSPTWLFFFSCYAFIHWHVTSHGTCSMAHRNCRYKKKFNNYLANYIWLLNCQLSLFSEKIDIYIYIENNTTYNQIHFSGHPLFGYIEVKTSAVFSVLQGKLNLTGPSPKVPEAHLAF